jgi:nucleoid-associated protein YgaU
VQPEGFQDSLDNAVKDVKGVKSLVNNTIVAASRNDLQKVMQAVMKRTPQKVINHSKINNLFNMALREKYKDVIHLAEQSGISDLTINEQNNVLYLNGSASSVDVKQKIWAAYQRIDPEMRSGDLVLDLKVGGNAKEQTYTVKSGDSLSKIAGNFQGLTWQEIFQANKDQISDPNLIHPGQVLKIPAN